MCLVVSMCGCGFFKVGGFWQSVAVGRRQHTGAKLRFCSSLSLCSHVLLKKCFLLLFNYSCAHFPPLFSPALPAPHPPCSNVLWLQETLTSPWPISTFSLSEHNSPPPSSLLPLGKASSSFAAISVFRFSNTTTSPLCLSGPWALSRGRTET